MSTIPPIDLRVLEIHLQPGMVAREHGDLELRDLTGVEIYADGNASARSVTFKPLDSYTVQTLKDLQSESSEASDMSDHSKQRLLLIIAVDHADAEYARDEADQIYAAALAIGCNINYLPQQATERDIYTALLADPYAVYVAGHGEDAHLVLEAGRFPLLDLSGMCQVAYLSCCLSGALLADSHGPTRVFAADGCYNLERPDLRASIFGHAMAQAIRRYHTVDPIPPLIDDVTTAIRTQPGNMQIPMEMRI